MSKIALKGGGMLSELQADLLRVEIVEAVLGANHGKKGTEDLMDSRHGSV